MATRDRVLAPLDGKSATLFLVAGGLLLVFATNTAARVFAGMGTPPIHNILGPGGFFVGLLGVFSLYPRLADRSPVLGRVAAIVAGVPLVGWFVITVFGIGSTAGVLPGMSAVFPGAFVIVVFLTTMLTYVLFGLTSLWSDGHSVTVGFLLLVPAIPFLTLIVAVQVLPPVEWAEFVIDTGHALAHLALGIGLWSEGVPSARAGPTPDSTA